jgi:hypothetical protein
MLDLILWSFAIALAPLAPGFSWKLMRRRPLTDGPSKVPAHGADDWYAGA